MPLPLTIGTGRALLSLGPLAVFRSLLQAQATCAWFGPDATLSGWPCAVTGTNAAAGGSGTTLGALNGVPAPVLSGAGWYRTAAFASAIAQPLVTVTISQLTGNYSTHRTIHDSRTSATILLRHRDTNGNASIRATNLVVGTPIGTSPAVIITTFNGAASSVVRNGTTILSGDCGAGSMDGLSIGATATSVDLFIGPIALVAIFSGADYAARAAAVASAARSLIGV